MIKNLFKCYRKIGNAEIQKEYIWAHTSKDACKKYRNNHLLSKKPDDLVIEKIDYKTTSKGIKYVDFVDMDNPEHVQAIAKYYCTNCGKPIYDAYPKWCYNCDSEIIG